MQRLDVSGAVRPIYGSLGVKRLIYTRPFSHAYSTFLHFFNSVVKLQFFFLPWHNSPQWDRGSTLSRIHDHTRQDSSGRVISPKKRPLPEDTQHSQGTDVHATGGIRTHNPSKRAAANPRLRPRGYCDWQNDSQAKKNIGVGGGAFAPPFSHQVNAHAITAWCSTNLTWTGLALNPCLRNERPSTNGLICGTANRCVVPRHAFHQILRPTVINKFTCPVILQLKNPHRL